LPWAPGTMAAAGPTVAVEALSDSCTTCATKSSGCSGTSDLRLAEGGSDVLLMQLSPASLGAVSKSKPFAAADDAVAPAAAEDKALEHAEAKVMAKAEAEANVPVQAQANAKEQAEASVQAKAKAATETEAPVQAKGKTAVVAKVPAQAEAQATVESPSTDAPASAEVPAAVAPKDLPAKSVDGPAKDAGTSFAAALVTSNVTAPSSKSGGAGTRTSCKRLNSHCWMSYECCSRRCTRAHHCRPTR